MHKISISTSQKTHSLSTKISTFFKLTTEATAAGHTNQEIKKKKISTDKMQNFLC
jgi:hypothetical protein